jgi:hypothetical protein
VHNIITKKLKHILALPILMTTVACNGISGALSTTINSAATELIPSASASLVTSSSVTLTSSAVDVILLSATGAPVAGKTVVLNSNRGTVDIFTPASAKTNLNGIASFTVSTTAVGGAIYSATDVDDSVTVAQTVSVSYLSQLTSMGISFWFNSSIGVTSSSGSVLGWADQSGNGNDLAQITSANQPTLVANGLGTNPILHFSGTQWLESPTGYPTSSDYWVFAVGRVSDFSVYNNLVATATTGFATLGFFPSPNLVLFHDSTYVEATVDLTVNTFFLAEAGYQESTGDAIVYTNGVGSTVGTIGRTNTDPTLNVGAYNNDYPLHGDIAEVLMFHQLLSTSQQQQVENYLNLKYSLY